MHKTFFDVNVKHKTFFDVNVNRVQILQRAGAFWVLTLESHKQDLGESCAQQSDLCDP
jgi:hypothetical protein